MASNSYIAGDSRERLHLGERGGSFYANNDPALRIMATRVETIRRGLSAMRNAAENVYKLELDDNVRRMRAGTGTREKLSEDTRVQEVASEMAGHTDMLDELIREGVGATENPEAAKYQQPFKIDVESARQMVERAHGNKAEDGSTVSRG